MCPHCQILTLGIVPLVVLLVLSFFTVVRFWLVSDVKATLTANFTTTSDTHEIKTQNTIPCTYHGFHPTSLFLPLSLSTLHAIIATALYDANSCLSSKGLNCPPGLLTFWHMATFELLLELLLTYSSPIPQICFFKKNTHTHRKLIIMGSATTSYGQKTRD